MQTYALANDYTLTVSEMSRRSQLAISSWFNEWFLSSSATVDKLSTVSAISTQIILHSRVALYRGAEKLPDGTYTIDDDLTLTLPLTEARLNDLPYSCVAWMIDAAGKENQAILENFLAGVRASTKNGSQMFARLSGSGLSSRPTPPS